MFNFIAEILELLYKLWPSYGVTIILLTAAIRLLLTPLTIKGTKSMLEMRKVQPELKKLQAQYKHDRVRLNQELSQLYREHNINPLGGCLPLLAQMPVFLVLYQVIRGLTRRASEVGYAIGKGVSAPQSSSLEPEGVARFNPDWLDTEDSMFQALKLDTEMISWGLDLALTPWRVLNEDIVKGLPYLGLILLTGVLSYFQQRQISGRTSDDPNPQQRILMRIIPIFIPIISFNLPTALVVYFITTNVVGVAQQAFLTRRVYTPHAETVKEQEAKAIEGEDSKPAPPPEKPRGLLGSFSTPPEPPKHGAPPLSKPPKPKPPKASPQNKPKAIPPKSSQPKPDPKNAAPTNKNTGNKKSKSQQPPPPPQKPTSKRITPKKDPNEQFKRKRR